MVAIRNPHQRKQLFELIGKLGSLGDPVSAEGPARQATMDDLPAFLRSHHADRAHRPTAPTAPVTGCLVDMQGMQTAVAVIAIAAIRQWGYVCTTVVAHESRVLFVSRQSPISQPVADAMAEVGCG